MDVLLRTTPLAAQSPSLPPSLAYLPLTITHFYLRLPNTHAKCQSRSMFLSAIYPLLLISASVIVLVEGHAGARIVLTHVLLNYPPAKEPYIVIYYYKSSKLFSKL